MATTGNITPQGGQGQSYITADQHRKALSKMEKDFKKDLERREARVYEVLTVFVAILTFISVNVTIFTRVQNLSDAVWFMVIMAVCVSFLTSLLLMFLSERQNWFKTTIFILSILIICGALYVTRVYFDSKLNLPADAVQQQLTFQQLEITKLQGR
jgi:heme/copper-type cytochrome/quinol oxidase subunit 4